MIETSTSVDSANKQCAPDFIMEVDKNPSVKKMKGVKEDVGRLYP